MCQSALNVVERHVIPGGIKRCHGLSTGPVQRPGIYEANRSVTLVASEMRMAMQQIIGSGRKPRGWKRLFVPVKNRDTPAIKLQQHWNCAGRSNPHGAKVRQKTSTGIVRVAPHKGKWPSDELRENVLAADISTVDRELHPQRVEEAKRPANRQDMIVTV